MDMTVEIAGGKRTEPASDKLEYAVHNDSIVIGIIVRLYSAVATSKPGDAMGQLHE